MSLGCRRRQHKWVILCPDLVLEDGYRSSRALVSLTPASLNNGPACQGGLGAGGGGVGRGVSQDGEPTSAWTGGMPVSQPTHELSSSM